MKDKLTAIHNQAMRILKEIGIKLHHPDLVDRIQENGVSVKGKTAFFTPDQIMNAVHQAPESFTLHARNPRYDMVIGKDNVNCAPGYGCSSICGPDGKPYNAMMADYVRFAKLIHQCPHFNINGGILAQPWDVPSEMSHLLMVYAAMVSSDKCLMGVPGNKMQMQEIMDLAALTFGSKDVFAAKPHLLTLISTISPLQIDKMALDAMIVAAHHNQPMVISPGPANGTTGPVDMAANLSMATAEALAAITIVQMINPGTPVVFGLQCLGTDLRTGKISIGSPGYTLQSKYTAELARMYHLPSRCSGALTDAENMGTQSAYESMMNLFATYHNGTNLILHSAGILDSFSSISYEKFLMDIELIDMVQYYFNDLVVNPETLNFPVIEQVGAGGQFLSTMDTLSKCRSHAWHPTIGVRGKSKGVPEKKFMEKIAEKKRLMLEAYSPPELNQALVNDLDDFLVHKGIDQKWMSSIYKQIFEN
jgi:trimethylamine--corrinoid protein Co-methyltransferase